MNLDSGIAPLISMDLSGNQLGGVDSFMNGTYDIQGLVDFVAVVNSIGIRSRLKRINLNKNMFDVKCYSQLSILLSGGPASLLELYLRDCGASDESTICLMEGMKINKTLAILDISQNIVGLEASDSISKMLLMGSRLKQLVMSECYIGPEGASMLMRALQTNAALEVLVIGDNNIQDFGADALASMLKVNNFIKRIDVQENSISNVGMLAIASALKINRSLAFLGKGGGVNVASVIVSLYSNTADLCRNCCNVGVQWNTEITNESVGALCEALSQNSILRSLHILGTQITDSGIRMIMNKSITIGDKKFDLDLSFAFDTDT